MAAIARAGSDVHVARALFARSDAERAWAVRDLRARDAEVATRLESLFRDRDLMSAAEHELLAPAKPRPRTGDDGVAWDLLTGASETSVTNNS
jgi:hypothetical protein